MPTPSLLSRINAAFTKALPIAALVIAGASLTPHAADAQRAPVRPATKPASKAPTRRKVKAQPVAVDTVWVDDSTYVVEETIGGTVATSDAAPPIARAGSSSRRTNPQSTQNSQSTETSSSSPTTGNAADPIVSAAGEIMKSVGRDIRSDVEWKIRNKISRTVDEATRKIIRP